MQTSLIVMGIETVIIIVVAIGWYLGARRMNFNLHHVAVYSVILVHLIIVGAWMWPRAMYAIENFGLLNDPVGNLRILAHFGIGLTADLLSIILALVFIWKRDIPLNVLRRARPVMILTLILWIISFGLGAYNLLLRYI